MPFQREITLYLLSFFGGCRALRLIAGSVLLLILSFGMADFARAQEVRFHRADAYPGLQDNPYPASAAMGGGTVALAGRPGAIRLNPAAIGNDGVIRVGLNVGTQEVAATSVDAPNIREDGYIASPSAAVRVGRWAFGAQYLQYSAGRRLVRSLNGNVVDRITPKHWALRAVGAYDVAPAWTVGVGVGYAVDNQYKRFYPERIRDLGSAATLTFDLGVHGAWTLRRGTRGTLRPSIGVSLTDFGANDSALPRRFVRYQTETRRNQIVAFPRDVATPTRLRLGGALVYAVDREDGEDTAARMTVHAALSKELAGRVAGVEGGTYGAFEALVRSWRPANAPVVPEQVVPRGVAVPELSTETVSVWGQIAKHVGAEVTLYDAVSVRAGHRQIDPDFSNRRYTTLGAGLDLGFASVDYVEAFGEPREIGDVRYVRLDVRLPVGVF
jgi:hypothetical protein